MAATTLVEAAKLRSGIDPVQSAVIELFAESSHILRVLPFVPIQGNATTFNQRTTLPGSGFRGVNEGYSKSTGTLNKVTESLAICGGDLDVDVFIVETMGPGQRELQEAGQIMSLAQLFTYKFIKGDSENSDKEFDGLQTRLDGDQVVSNGSSSGGDPLSLNKLDELIDAVDNANALVMNKGMARRLTQASRNSGVGGFITFEQREMGKKVTMYQDLPIIITDENDSQFAGTAFDEAATGGGSTATSIYALNLGENSLHGIQNGDMRVRDLGEIDDQPVYRTRCEWYASIAMKHPRAAARLRDISDAPVAV